ncbi:MAG: hypothetical protein B6241_06920 [Spirochaetaceae bacterium 4572_59]|nr:MAG: hypothetical protein B6241_06920 [Spirochaetaceae bacterium 4572_59]
MKTKVAFTILFFLILTMGFSQSTEKYKLGRVVYFVEGNVRESALNSVLNWKYHHIFHDKWEMESYLRDQKQILINKKIFKSVTSEYKIISSDRGYNELEIIFKLKEAWNIYPIPVYTYDSNFGMITGLGITYNNFAGTLSDLKLNSYYSPGKSEITSTLKGVRVGSFDLNFTLSHFWETVKSIDTHNDINLEYSYAKAQFDISFLFHVINKMDYIFTPSLSLPYSYNVDINDTHEADSYYREEGLIPSLSHMFLFDKVNWIGNLRQGFSVSIENGLDYLAGEKGYMVWVDCILTSFIYTSVLNYSSRASYFHYTNGYKVNSGDRLRGILDYKLTGTNGFFWNQNFVIPVVTIPSVVDLHITPFVDLGLVGDRNSIFKRDDMFYTAGVSLSVFPAPLPNMQISMDFGVNLKDRTETEVLISSVLFF